MFDLDAYLERIGIKGTPSLAEVHRSHVTAIPFENIDPQRGVPISLEMASLARKLVDARRGGYCFEQNLLLKAALEALGFEPEMMLARVRMGSAAGTRPRTHLVLRVHTADGALLADVGFGQATLLEPIPLTPGPMYEQSGWRYRLVAQDEELVLQTETDTGPIDLYGFIPQPVPQVDVETSNWFTCTHPRSPFVTGLIVAAQHPDGSRTSLSDRGEQLAITKQTPSGSTATPVDRKSVPMLLELEFGLTGFALDEAGRIVPAR